MRLSIKALPALLLPLLLLGCAASSPPTRYYLLNPVQDVAPLSEQRLALRVGPLEIAEYIQRKGIATRNGEYQLSYSTRALWAAPLSDQLPAVLRQSLAALLPGADISSHYSGIPVHARADFQLTVEILRFDGRLDDSASLSATWQIFRLHDRVVVAQGDFEQSAAVTGGQHTNLVAAQNALFDIFSQTLASAVVSQLE